MKSAVIVFPGSNCDRDMQVALRDITGTDPVMVWHKETDFPDVDLIAVPGGFSYGDYLRSGAIASRSPVMAEVIRRADAGVFVLGVCNGFQVLTEAGLLPGVLMRNADLKFVCRDVHLKVEHTETPFTRDYDQAQVIRIPVAHHDGNYFADAETLTRLEGEGQVAFRYCNENGNRNNDGGVGANPNGSIHDIAGVYNAKKNVLGMMPHPERLTEAAHGGTDGRALFEGLMKAIG